MENTLKFYSVAAANSHQLGGTDTERAVLHFVLVNGEGILKELIARSNLGIGRELTEFKLKDKYKFILELQLLIV